MRPVSGRAERWLWVALLALVALSRLWNLGARVVTHDESIHARYSLELARSGTYVHDPAFHGPLLYHVNAAVFFLFGASDFTVRLVPALCGIAVVAAVYAFRRHLGRTAAFSSAMLMTLSPTLTFYSRHLRNDVYIALFTLIWIHGAFRFLEDRRRRWFYLVAGVMGLAFAAKEVSFIVGAVIGVFFLALAFGKGRGDDLRRLAALELALFMLTLVLPFAAGPLSMLAGWNPGEPMSPLGVVLVGSLFGLSAGSVLLWGFMARRSAVDARLTPRHWLAAAALFWGLQIVLFTSGFRNVAGGLTSGIAGSLGFWLTQHAVGRGDQPWFFYGILGLLYEFLPLMLAAVALPWLLLRLRRGGWDPGPSSDPVAAPPALRRLFAAFLVWWTVASWTAFSLAGERMPWLLVHMVLPLCLLGGWSIARLARPNGSAGTARSLAIAGIAAACPVVVVALLIGRPFQGRDLAAVSRTLDWWAWLALLVLLIALLVRVGAAMPRRESLRLAAVGVVGLATLLTLRTGWKLDFVNFDLPVEPISYAQGSPDVRRAVARLERIAAGSTARQPFVVAYDTRVAWPLGWYLRDHLVQGWSGDAGGVLGAPVIVVSTENESRVRPLLERGYVRHEYQNLCWPLRGYRGLTPPKLWRVVADPDERERLWRIAFHRDFGDRPLSEWPVQTRFAMWVRADLSGDVGPGEASR